MWYEMKQYGITTLIGVGKQKGRDLALPHRCRCCRSSCTGSRLKPMLCVVCCPRFCGECLQPCLQVTSPLCPLCRVPFDPKKVERSSSVEKQLASYKAPCRGCSKKVSTKFPVRPHHGCLAVQDKYRTRF